MKKQTFTSYDDFLLDSVITRQDESGRYCWGFMMNGHPQAMSSDRPIAEGFITQEGANLNAMAYIKKNRPDLVKQAKAMYQEYKKYNKA